MLHGITLYVWTYWELYSESEKEEIGELFPQVLVSAWPADVCSIGSGDHWRQCGQIELQKEREGRRGSEFNNTKCHS